ncbi:MAG: flagella basal body P-ring formation protein FlgA [Planctomycetes bacterium]|nr:flagella basal body P-ring formation protein FlgA [Planctomycetota bacterium]
MKLISLLILLGTDIALKKEAEIQTQYICLFDLIGDVASEEGLSKEDKEVFQDIYLGKTSEKEVVKLDDIMFELRYRNIKLDKYRFVGDLVRISNKQIKTEEELPKVVRAIRAKRDLSKGSSIRKDDIEYIFVGHQTGILQNASDVISSIAVNSLKSGEIITKEKIKKNGLLKKGSPIVIKGEFLECTGKTLKDAVIDDVIQCVVKGIADPITIKVISEKEGRLILGGSNDSNK